MPAGTDPLAALRAGYVRKLPEKKSELDAAVAGLSDPDKGPPVGAVRMIVHKLAGSAATFGLPVLGEAARAVERACDAALQAGGEPNEAALAVLRDKLAAFDAAMAEAVTNGPVATPAAAPGPAAKERFKGRVLVIDDEPAQARFVQIVLERLGIDVAVETDSAKACDSLTSFAPNLVLLDMNMPGMDGESVARAIRARGDHFSGVPIVFLSGEEDAERRAAALEAGGQAFVAKPVQAGDLADTMKRYLIRAD